MQRSKLPAATTDSSMGGLDAQAPHILPGQIDGDLILFGAKKRPPRIMGIGVD